jgi:hypothetical protein
MDLLVRTHYLNIDQHGSLILGELHCGICQLAPTKLAGNSIMFSNPRMKTIPQNHGSWVVSRSCSTLKVTHQSSNAAETQYNWLCVAELYSHYFLVRDLKYKCVRQWLCVFPMVSRTHFLRNTLSWWPASWLGKTPIMRRSLVGVEYQTCLVASRFFFPLFFTVLWYWKFGESFQKNRKISWIYTRRKLIKIFRTFWQKTKINHWLPSVLARTHKIIIIIIMIF